MSKPNGAKYRIPLMVIRKVKAQQRRRNKAARKSTTANRKRR